MAVYVCFHMMMMMMLYSFSMPTEPHKIGYAGLYGNFRKLIDECRWEEAHAAQADIQEQGMRINNTIWTVLINQCIDKKKGLETARGIWKLVQDSSFQSNAYLGTHLIRMFNLLGSVDEANEVFSQLTRPNVYTWNAIIAANARHGQGHEALKLYYQMFDMNVEPDDYVFASALKGCASIG